MFHGVAHYASQQKLIPHIFSLEIWTNTLLWFVHVKHLLSISSPGALLCKRGWRLPAVCSFSSLPLCHSLREGWARCNNRGREKARAESRGVGQQGSTAARDTVGNVAWKCSASCSSVIPADTSRHSETCLGYVCMAGWRRFVISLMHSDYLSLSFC